MENYFNLNKIADVVSNDHIYERSKQHARRQKNYLLSKKVGDHVRYGSIYGVHRHHLDDGLQEVEIVKTHFGNKNDPYVTVRGWPMRGDTFKLRWDMIYPYEDGVPLYTKPKSIEEGENRIKDQLVNLNTTRDEINKRARY